VLGQAVSRDNSATLPSHTDGVPSVAEISFFHMVGAVMISFPICIAA